MIYLFNKMPNIFGAVQAFPVRTLQNYEIVAQNCLPACLGILRGRGAPRVLGRPRPDAGSDPEAMEAIR